MLSAAERYRPLGRDRFFNRYWWFDAGIGAYPFELINQDIDRQVKTKSKVGSEAGPLVWASGCLFVEDFGLDKFHSSQVEAIQLGMVDGKWGHYSTPEDVNLHFFSCKSHSLHFPFAHPRLIGSSIGSMSVGSENWLYAQLLKNFKFLLKVEWKSGSSSSTMILCLTTNNCMGHGFICSTRTSGRIHNKLSLYKQSQKFHFL